VGILINGTSVLPENIRFPVQLVSVLQKDPICNDIICICALMALLWFSHTCKKGRGVVQQRGAQAAGNGAYGYAARGVRVGEPFQQPAVDYQGSAAVRNIIGLPQKLILFIVDLQQIHGLAGVKYGNMVAGPLCLCPLNSSGMVPLLFGPLAKVGGFCGIPLEIPVIA
jgi:hypothetical protein